MKAAIVVPTNREASVKEFLAEWQQEFRGHSVIVVEDNPVRSFDLPEWVAHYSWQEIDSDLRGDAWVIPKRTGGIRNYGVLVASRMDVDMIVMLDDDCRPMTPRGFLTKHWEALETPCLEYQAYDTMRSIRGVAGDIMARGYPKRIPEMRTVLNHGLWNGFPDIDGETQLKHQDFRSLFPDENEQIPRGSYFPMSAMNVAFRPEIVTAMYQMPMGEGEPFHRFDDIWCGLVMKKACDAVGLGVRSGSPSIRHIRQSSADRNRQLEEPGIIENEVVWEAIANMAVPSESLDLALTTIHFKLQRFNSYWGRAMAAASLWRSLTMVTA